MIFSYYTKPSFYLLEGQEEKPLLMLYFGF